MKGARVITQLKLETGGPSHRPRPAPRGPPGSATPFHPWRPEKRSAVSAGCRGMHPNWRDGIAAFLQEGVWHK